MITKITFDSKHLDPKVVLNTFLVYASHSQCPEGICWSVGQILWTLGGQNEFGIAKNLGHADIVSIIEKKTAKRLFPLHD